MFSKLSHKVVDIDSNGVTGVGSVLWTLLLGALLDRYSLSTTMFVIGGIMFTLVRWKGREKGEKGVGVGGG